MRKNEKRKIEDIQKRYSILEKFINNSKMLENQEEKDNLIFSIKYIIYIILKYSNKTKGNL